MEKHGLKIGVLDKGFVYVGEWESDGEWLYCKRASCVRLWGTTNGLGQLAECGPQSGTKLDKSPDLKVRLQTLQFFIAINEKNWKSVFSKCGCACGKCECDA